jgi:hypothetical protein
VLLDYLWLLENLLLLLVLLDLYYLEHPQHHLVLLDLLHLVLLDYLCHLENLLPLLALSDPINLEHLPLLLDLLHQHHP